jgi:hypothetical protein
LRGISRLHDSETLAPRQIAESWSIQVAHMAEDSEFTLNNG